MRAFDNDCNLMLVIELNFTKIEYGYYLVFVCSFNAFKIQYSVSSINIIY